MKKTPPERGERSLFACRPSSLFPALNSCRLVWPAGHGPTHLIGNAALHAADATGSTRPSTKHNCLVRHVNDLARQLHEAFYVARSGRPGPVVVDLPKDVLFAPGA